MKPLGVLDRYLLRQWLATFVLSAVGVPAVAILIDLAERFGKLADKGVTVPDILLGQLYLFPNKMAMMLPAAVLFATVFTLNALGRNSELTAVKAGGISFYRLIAPMMGLALLSVPLDFALQEWSSYTTTREKELHKERLAADAQFRPTFVFASPTGWVWAIKQLDRGGQRLSEGVLLDRPDSVLGGRWSIFADSAHFFQPGRWTLQRGAASLIRPDGRILTLTFRTMASGAFSDPPGALMDEGKKAEEMTLPELRHYLATLRASGIRPGMLEVDLPLKYAVPLACLVVALFGAPLALTNPRAGAALGLAIALGTTLIFLTGIQIMKALGGKAVVEPWVAAWSMDIVFGFVALVLLARVRS